MDPVTHGVIGLAISAFSGDPVSMMNPISIGCAIGAMAPDIDIVAKVKGDYVYLKHHRGFTHSLPALIGFAGLITIGLSMFFDTFSFLNVFIWTFIGCFSHTLFDILNSYGAKLFMPFSKKKSMVGILMLYDPIITVLSGLLIFVQDKSFAFYIAILVTFALYIAFRLYMKHYASQIIKKDYCDYNITDINVLPALMAFHKWDFIIDDENYHIVGQVNLITKSTLERKRFTKPEKKFVEMFDETNIGKYFKEFTPIYHITSFKDVDKVVVKSIDLRYYLRNNFMHHATAIYDTDNNVIESFFHPYNINKRIPVLETD